MLRGARFPDLAPPADRSDGQPVADLEWFDLGAAAARRIAEIAREEQTTPPVVMLTAFLAVLRSATGGNAVAACAVISDREEPELRDTVGFLARTVVVPFTATGVTRAA